MNAIARTDQPAARVATIDRATALRLAATEYQRVVDQWRALPADAWSQPTECPGWDVRAMAGHTLGMAEMAGSAIQAFRQQRAANKRGGVFIDALTAHQVETRASLSTAELIARMQRAARTSPRGRQRAPGFVRRQTVAFDLPEGPEVWTKGFLFDTILTRDPWMHRVDTSRACGAPLTLTPDHDGVLVADAAREWAGRHGQPCTLRLTGPAGGTFTFGADGPLIELDAVEFCRAVSGRGDDAPPLSTHVPF